MEVNGDREVEFFGYLMLSELAVFPELLTIYRRIAASFLLALHPISRQNFLSSESWDSLLADFGELEFIASLNTSCWCRTCR